MVATGNDARGASRALPTCDGAQNLRVRENKTAIIISFLVDFVCHSRWFELSRETRKNAWHVYDMREAHVVLVSWCVVVSGFLLRLFVTFFFHNGNIAREIPIRRFMQKIPYQKYIDQSSFHQVFIPKRIMGKEEFIFSVSKKKKKRSRRRRRLSAHSPQFLWKRKKYVYIRIFVGFLRHHLRRDEPDKKVQYRNGM